MCTLMSSLVPSAGGPNSRRGLAFFYQFGEVDDFFISLGNFLGNHANLMGLTGGARAPERADRRSTAFPPALTPGKTGSGDAALFCCYPCGAG